MKNLLILRIEDLNEIPEYSSRLSRIAQNMIKCIKKRREKNQTEELKKKKELNK